MPGPFTHEVSQVLRLHNPTSDPMAFKVKTTAPKQYVIPFHPMFFRTYVSCRYKAREEALVYRNDPLTILTRYCVRPNSGRIEGGRNVEVQVLLQAMKQDPAPDAKCRDKFLVQSVAIPASAEKDATVTQIWSGIEETNKASIQETKIRVNFLPAESTAPASSSATTNGVSEHHSESPPSYSSPAQHAAPVTPQRTGPVSEPRDRPLDNKHLGDAVNSANNPSASPASTYSAAPAHQAGGVSETAAHMGLPTSQEELKRQLNEAKATIARLQNQVQESSGLRQRKAETSAVGGEKSGSAAQQQLAPQSSGGVPIVYVVLLCLACFLLAFFLF